MNYNPRNTTNGSVIHIMVVWSKAMQHKDFIVEDLRDTFEVLKVFRGHWDKNKYLQNYWTFYAHSQYKCSPRAYKKILKNKINICGDGDFEVVIFRDNAPVFEERKTSSGVRIVNRRAFDKKSQYRELTKGGHRVHGSDDAWETNKDLTIMFGMNIEDFCKHYSITDSIETTNHDLTEDTLNHNCCGVGGYESIQQFFYVLNNSIQYVVLRNHEPIPEEYTVVGHGDIDFLVENKNYMRYLTLARPGFIEPHRVYHYVNIKGEEIPMDFRFVGDNYYFLKWEKEILETRVLLKELFYAPNSENQFYSLLYHAYIQKNEVKEDYHPKLEYYGNQINITYHPNIESALSILDKFMEKKQYEYVRPKDYSVIYNKNHLSKSKYALQYGQFIKHNEFHDEYYGLCFTYVYEKENSFVKIGNDWLIENERKHLESLKDTDFVPQIIEYRILKDGVALLEISRVKGIVMEQFFKQQKNITSTIIRSVINKSLEIQKVLIQHRIVHQDIAHENLLVHREGDNISVFLIDFGWAITIDELEKPVPFFLGECFASPTNKCDAFEFGNFIKTYFRNTPYFNNIKNVLTSVKKEDYAREQTVELYIDNAIELSKKSFNWEDYFFILVKRIRWSNIISKYLTILGILS